MQEMHKIVNVHGISSDSTIATKNRANIQKSQCTFSAMDAWHTTCTCRYYTCIVCAYVCIQTCIINVLNEIHGNMKRATDLNTTATHFSSHRYSLSLCSTHFPSRHLSLSHAICMNFVATFFSAAYFLISFLFAIRIHSCKRIHLARSSKMVVFFILNVKWLSFAMANLFVRN